MCDHKRNASTFGSMEASFGATLSKKRKTASLGSRHLQSRSSNSLLRSSVHLRDATLCPATSVNSAGTVVSGEYFSGRFPQPCCSVSSTTVENNGVGNDSTAALDLEAKVFETVDSTYSNFQLLSKDKYSLSEFSGDSEEITTVFPAKSSTAAIEHRKSPAVKTAPKEEIEEFFAMAEKYEQKRFAEKYNYDIVQDMPLQGRYQWARFNLKQ